VGRRYSPVCLSVDAIGVSVARLRAGVQSKVHSLPACGGKDAAAGVHCAGWECHCMVKNGAGAI
jgi:hypothetical protein